MSAIDRRALVIEARGWPNVDPLRVACQACGSVVGVPCTRLVNHFKIGGPRRVEVAAHDTRVQARQLAIVPELGEALAVAIGGQS
jgi:hypothetical protein